ncbi:Hypothetical predicted protein [Olea europaea subsp. europaea]|uniref:Uncharacterized protein n=1 Tax=Olea europaea subsp. europaea TaxID=158383 RepID=A0A8S0QVJ1_OLEEU|nr:Hypothetical predicted protein [Olea europaea subsp. europaea]
MEIRSSMTFLSDSVTALISSTMDAIVAKATEKSEGHSVGDAPQQEKGSPPSAPTSGLAVKRAPKSTLILQSLYVTGAGKQIKHSDDAIVFDKHDKHMDETDVVAFQDWFNRAYGRLFSLSATVCPKKSRYMIVCYHN